MEEVERRLVLLVEWKAEGEEEKHVDFMRRIKWGQQELLQGTIFNPPGVEHKEFKARKRVEFLERLHPEQLAALGEREQLDSETALRLAHEYEAFVFSRLELEDLLGVEKPQIRPIRIFEDTPEYGRLETAFFIRKYVPGIPVDKFKDWRFRYQGFCTSLAELMGREATNNFARGRRNKYTGKILFGDGDEVIQCSGEKEGLKAENKILADGTGVLGNVDSPHTEFTPTYASWLAQMLERTRRVRNEGKEGEEKINEDLRKIAGAFFRGVRQEYERLQQLISKRGPQIIEQVKWKEPTPYIGLEYGWDYTDVLAERAFKRFMETSPEDFVDSIKHEESLDPFADLLD
jgi:hypothetical protein